MSIPPDPSEIETRAKRIRALILDVDGVLTDSRLLYLDNGQEANSFHARDGLGVQLFIASGGRVALVSGRESEAVTRRGRELGIELMRPPACLPGQIVLGPVFRRVKPRKGVVLVEASDRAEYSLCAI